ncbi:class I SAM-dependent methyltransferase [Streptomyces sp. DH37]|uniref:class I SAM-dependent methyltransferase n=1 Tax=Streptomyces sp. DH37 TaxID=3040122 RepID=UPI00244257EA|nr:class I SAM-dependent methyltransferase [Streptomyces sp. DH37]MDG9700716.1 class I SAM-dependent methyltransferase [Streptomyces sp. DH37]
MTTRTLRVDRSNAEQARAWDGEEGAYWAAHADRFDRAVRGYEAPLLDAAAIGPGDRVLDIGCGTGESARDAARLAVGGSVLGVDLSGQMLRVAWGRALGEGLGNIAFERADAQTHPFPDARFDIAVSRNGAVFFADPVAAFRNIARALRPGGRLVLLVWQPPSRNEWFLAFTAALAAGRVLPEPPPGAPGPFSLADPERARACLMAAGFGVPRVEGLSAPMCFGSDPEDAYRFVSGMFDRMLGDLGAGERNRALARLRASLAAHGTPDGVLYDSAAWLVTALRP